MSKSVDSRAALLSVWKTDEKCKDIISLIYLIWFSFYSLDSILYLSVFPDLLSAYCQWLPEALHQQVAESWPPV